MRDLGVLRGEPAEQGIAFQGVAEEAGLAGEVAGVEGGVGAEGFETVAGVVKDQGEGAEGEGEEGHGEAAGGEGAQQFAGEDGEGGGGEAGEHPGKERLVPQGQSEQEEAGGERGPIGIFPLVAAEEEEEGGAEEEVLEGDGSPIEGGGEEEEGVGGEQDEADEGGAGTGGAAEEREEERQGGGGEEQGGDADGSGRRRPKVKEGRVEPGLEAAKVAHEHERNFVSENRAEFGHADGFENAGGEEGLIVLNAEEGDEGQAGQEEKNTRRQGCEI